MSNGASYLGIGVDFDAVTDGAQFPLGSVVKDSSGDTYCYVKASADLTANYAYFIEADFEVKTALVSNNATSLGKTVCFPRQTIDGSPNAKYFWAQIGGHVKATFAADTTKSAPLYSSTTAGKLTGTSAANAVAVFGGSLTNAVDVSELATGVIAVPVCLNVAYSKQSA